MRLITYSPLFRVGRLTESQKKSGVEMPRASHTICSMDLRARERTNGPAGLAWILVSTAMIEMSNSSMCANDMTCLSSHDKQMRSACAYLATCLGGSVRIKT
jgi:hypothetical protein